MSPGRALGVAPAMTVAPQGCGRRVPGGLLQLATFVPICPRSFHKVGTASVGLHQDLPAPSAHSHAPRHLFSQAYSPQNPTSRSPTSQFRGPSGPGDTPFGHNLSSRGQGDFAQNSCSHRETQGRETAQKRGSPGHSFSCNIRLQIFQN